MHCSSCVLYVSTRYNSIRLQPVRPLPNYTHSLTPPTNALAHPLFPPTRSPTHQVYSLPPHPPPHAHTYTSTHHSIRYCQYPAPTSLRKPSSHSLPLSSFLMSHSFSHPPTHPPRVTNMSPPPAGAHSISPPPLAHHSVGYCQYPAPE